jgi:hypothetical protein
LVAECYLTYCCLGVSANKQSFVPPLADRLGSARRQLEFCRALGLPVI